MRFAINVFVTKQQPVTLTHTLGAQMSHSHLPISSLHFGMVDLFSLRRSFGPGAVLEMTAKPFACRFQRDARPNVNTRSVFAELAVELGLREVES